MACRVRGGGILIQTAIWRWVRAEHRAAEQRDGFDRVGCPILSRRTRGLSELGGCNPPDWLLPVLGRFMRDATRTKQFAERAGKCEGGGLHPPYSYVTPAVGLRQAYRPTQAV